jgi:hypothetical protein
VRIAIRKRSDAAIVVFAETPYAEFMGDPSDVALHHDNAESSTCSSASRRKASRWWRYCCRFTTQDLAATPTVARLETVGALAV